MKRPLAQSARATAVKFPIHIRAPQYEQIVRAAELSGDTIAAFIRSAAIKAAERTLKKAA